MKVIRIGAAGPQRGSTLIELVIALTIAGIVAAGAAVTMAQVLNMNTRNTISMTAVRNAQTAGYWMSIDAERANGIVGHSGNLSAPNVLQLTWLDSADISASHSANYTLQGESLFRSLDGVNSRIADHISSVVATYEAGELKINLTSEVNLRGLTGRETRTYTVTPRPGS